MGNLCFSARDGDYIMLVLPDGRTARIDVERERHHNKMRLHFDAPPDVGIWRGEVWERKQAEKERQKQEQERT